MKHNTRKSTMSNRKICITSLEIVRYRFGGHLVLESGGKKSIFFSEFNHKYYLKNTAKNAIH